MNNYTVILRKCPTNYSNDIFKSCDKETAIKAVELFEKSECVYNTIRKDYKDESRYEKWNLFLNRKFGLTSRDGIVIKSVCDENDNVVYKEGRGKSGIHTLIEHLL